MSDRLSKNSNPTRPSLCRNCGAIVGAGALQCGVCGASTAVPPAPSRLQRAAQASRPDRETIRFARAIVDRPYKFTIIFLVINIFVFLLMWDSSGLLLRTLTDGFPEPVLIAYGAKLNSLINAPYHQWWRFITPMFVHINVVHLLVNMYSLWMIGPYVEKLYGSAKFVFFWVLTGIAGVVGSYLTVRPSLTVGGLGHFLFKAGDGPSAGASGALFGLVGVLFVFGIKFRHELPEGFKRAFGTGMLPTILLNLFIGYVGSGFIDNGAHLGGLVSGAALALLVQYHRPGESATVNTIWRFIQVFVLTIVAIGFINVARNFRSGVELSRIPAPNFTVTSNNQILDNYLVWMNRAQETASMVIHDRDASGVESMSTALKSVPAPDERATELRDQLSAILTKMGAELAAQTKDAPRRPAALQDKSVNEYTAWRNEYEKWLKSATQQRSSGESNGIVVTH